MREAFTQEARSVVTRAEDEARDAGSRTIEAEHLLLAASGPVGLDRTEIADALAEEWRASLDAAGVGVAIPEPSRRGGRVKFGASAKLALERALRVAVDRGDKRIEARHVALGVLAAERGTVPRALERAGVDTAWLWRA